MKALEITGENLEDLLAYDDLFLDYFNAFLALPVFPQPLAYNRLLGAFEEVSDPHPATGSLPRLTSPARQYGATDHEREKMLEWAREERLPVFLRTQLFRELKLVKLLLRPLDDRPSASRGSSRNLRGYSRESESYFSSLSNTMGNSTNNGLDDEDELWNDLSYSALFPYQRPGSRALSVPAKTSFRTKISSTPSINSSAGTSKSMSAKHSRKAASGAAMTSILSSGKPPDTAKKAARGRRNKDGIQMSTQIEVIPDESRAESQRTTQPQTAQSKRGAPHSSTEEAFLRGARVLSAPVNYEEFLKMPVLYDLDALIRDEPMPDGPTYVTFEDDGMSEKQAETDMQNMAGRLKMSVQQMKEMVLGSYAGVDAFKEFLVGTAGYELVNFWLDCEFYKDTMEDYDEVSNMEARNRLFRDIQDKYKLNLTQDAKEQIARVASNAGLSHTIFLRTQYDVLRRLRVYWVPRFLIHFERTKDMSLGSSGPSFLRPWMRNSMKNPVPFFPSISLVRSLPVWPDEALAVSRSDSWDSFNKGTTSRDLPLAKQGRAPSRSKPLRQRCVSRSTKERFVMSLTLDQLAGGPFQRYLEQKVGDVSLVANLLFWQDVTEYGAEEDRSADRLLRHNHAWAIYNKYISTDSPFKIDLTAKERDELHKTLLSARNFVEASIFDTAKYKAIERLERAWIRYLKEDLKSFLDCRVRPGMESPPSTAEAIEITVTDTEVIIKRPRPWVRKYPGSSERARRLRNCMRLGDDLNDEQRAELKRIRAEKRKEMEKERRKAVRAAYNRQKLERMKARLGSGYLRVPDMEKKEEESSELLDGEQLPPEEPELPKEKPPPTFHDFQGNKQIMQLFRKHVHDSEQGKELGNQMHLYQEIEAYTGTKDTKNKKDAAAIHIYKTYLDPNSKKYVPVTEKVQAKLQAEKDRPKTPTLREIYKGVLPKIEDSFKDFIEQQADDLGVEPREILSMSHAELVQKLGNDQAMLSGWKKKGKGKADGSSTAALGGDQLPTTRPMDTPSAPNYLTVTRRGRRYKTMGRVQPTREDKNEFLIALSQSSYGHPTLEMLYFYKYLVKFGEEDGIPLIDKDLFFYIEVQKFKECSHAYADEEMLKRKVQSINDCFLDSVTTPSLQISLPGELHQRTLKTVQKYLTGKEVTQQVFDDAQIYIFKELLPYWAGFKRTYNPPEDTSRKPVTKYQKMLRRRLDTIENYQAPAINFTLPTIPEGGVPSYSISLSDGVKLKTGHEASEDSTSITGTPVGDHRSSRMTAAQSVEGSRKGRRIQPTPSSAATTSTEPSSRGNSVTVR